MSAVAAITENPNRVATGKLTKPADSDVAALDNAVATRDWSAFERIVVAFSGGKDSLACLLRLLDLGVPKDKLELWHHDVDGREGSGLMDWPVTADYCRKVAEHFDIPCYFSWKKGGFEGEMLRDDAPTQATAIELPGGEVIEVGGKGPRNTRMKFPQVSADLKVRWCSAYLKVDVGTKVFANDPRFQSGGRFLLVTGERREESKARSRYAEIEKDRACTKSRNVLRWRAVIDFSEQEVWDLIEKHQVRVHPAYELGFGRVSCMACIFGSRDQWAAVKELDEKRFEKIAQYEERFGLTIKRNESVREQADKGTSLVADKPAELKDSAMNRKFKFNILDNNWELPSGAFQECGGPT